MKIFSKADHDATRRPETQCRCKEVPDCLVMVVNVQWYGSEALELTYKTPNGRVANELVYRSDEPRLELVEQGRPWSFDGDGAMFRLVSEAHRIHLAHLFDPVLAVHTSLVDPLPHQITAVYGEMLPRQPLRFLLADDPGAGKTIMAGLLIKELIARGDLLRCLIVCPGSLAEQWQDELYRRFSLPFEILTNDKLEAARTGNWFMETNLVIARLDKLSFEEAGLYKAVTDYVREAFQKLGGTDRKREPRRYEITHVPAAIQNRDRLIGMGEPVLAQYERITFEKELIHLQGQPLAAFVCPGHPLLDSVIDLTLERHRDLLKRGSVLVDNRDDSQTPRVLFYLEHAIQDAGITRSGDRRIVSRQMLYVELDADGNSRHMHYAPYLDFRPLKEGEPSVADILERPECNRINGELEHNAQGYAVAQVVPEHLKEVRDSRLTLIAKTEAAVKERLTKEITYWDHRSEQLKLQEQAGKINARLNSGEARKRADSLQARLQKRLEELRLEAQISPLPPVVIAGILILPNCSKIRSRPDEIIR